MTTETHMQETLRSCSGEAAFVSMYFEPVITNTAQLQTHICLGSSTEYATAT